MCKYRNNDPLKGSFSETLWELCHYTPTKCSFTSTFTALSAPWLLWGSGRRPSRLLPQLCSGTPACSGGTQCSCRDSKGLPGRVRTGSGQLQKVPARTFFSSSRAGKLCYLLTREGQAWAFLFCLGSRKAKEMKFHLMIKIAGKPSLLSFRSL